MYCTACGFECHNDKYPEVVFKDEESCICEECSIDYEEVDGKVQLRQEIIEWNEKVFKDVPKQDLISSRQHFQDKNVELSNELYQLKKYLEQIENDKKDLQIKLEKARACVKCYECKDDSCINNIWHKK